MITTTVQLRVSIEVQSDPISGSVAGPLGESRRFSGWVELAAAIEAVRDRRAGGAAAETLGWSPGAKA